MHVIKRNGQKEKVNLNKITTRIRKLKKIFENEIQLQVDEILISQKVVQGLYDGVTTRELDNLAAETSAMMSIKHPDYSKMAARIEVSSLHKETDENFLVKSKKLIEIGILSENYFNSLDKNHAKIIDYNRDYLIDYFGIKTLKKSYLLKNKKGEIIERPQDLWMRVSAFVHKGDFKRIKQTYDLISNKKFTHATPTLFNAGTVRHQLSSCFLLDIHDDSISGIYKTLSDCAKISKSAGGIGLSIHKIRSKDSYIAGTNGTSSGIVPMLRCFDSTARYVDQGGGKRKGSFAIYLEPWHADIFEFLELKKNHGKEEMRARDLFYALWIPDLFMRRVEADGDWTLFDPKKAREGACNILGYENRLALEEAHSEEFERIYCSLEKSKVGTRAVRARDLWDKIIESQIETGTPYMLYKDAANSKSNQKNLGTIKSSNLCTEIIEYTDENEIAVCNLGSICLSEFAQENKVDYKGIYIVARTLTRNLDNIININYYPVSEALKSNKRQRPIGIGVQGLADLFAKINIPFTSDEAKRINKKIFEILYKGAIDESIQLAKERGVYETYKGSPAHSGALQFDLWGINRDNLEFNWKKTFENLASYGLRNSLLLAPMPTASTAQIFGNNEAFEPFTSNLYVRRTLSGEFIVINRHLVHKLIELGLWDDQMAEDIKRYKGSVQYIDRIPKDVKEVYRTVWEMSMKDIIDMAADRGAFICQSQSMNLFLESPTANKITSMHFYAWKKGLKTGMSTLR